MSCRRGENRKGAGTNSGESGAKNLEAESIRSRAESTGGCVKLKTVTETIRSIELDTIIANSVYLVLNSLLDWEPVQRLKQRSDVVSFMSFLRIRGRNGVWGVRKGAHVNRELGC